ncbi:MAG: hypothetical protein HW403_881 [Dehalococcoidia bacterium]|nr:hypothetical protein [Dehalococcoidia bacterium]
MPKFLIIIEKADGNYAAYSPDLPGYASNGKTLEQVKKNVQKAIELHLEWLREEGLPIPDSQSLAEYMDFPSEQIRSVSDEVRAYTLQRIIMPARQGGTLQVEIKVRDVHNALGLRNRFPLVCSALTSRPFAELAGVRLVKSEGPPSGKSSSVVLTFALTDKPDLP